MGFRQRAREVSSALMSALHLILLQGNPGTQHPFPDIFPRPGMVLVPWRGLRGWWRRPGALTGAGRYSFAEAGGAGLAAGGFFVCPPHPPSRRRQAVPRDEALSRVGERGFRPPAPSPPLGPPSGPPGQGFQVKTRSGTATPRIFRVTEFGGQYT